MTATAVADPASPLLEKMTPEARAFAQGVRALIKSVCPDLAEGVHMGWEYMYYSAGGKMRDMVCALGHRPTYVNIEFGDGALLSDPAHKLEGTGKRLRHVKIRSSDAIQDPAVRALIVEAVERRGLVAR